MIQGAILSSRVHALVTDLDRQLENLKVDPDYNVLNDDDFIGLDVTDHRTLRVIVHLVFILQSLGVEFTQHSPYYAAAENIIAAYIGFLSLCGKNELIPLYAGRLSPAKAVDVVGGILVSVKDDGQRFELLRLMRMHFIDVEGCLVKTMEVCLELTQGVYERERKGVVRLAVLKGEGLKGELSREDDMLVRGLEWLVLGGDGLKSEVIKKGVVVYKRFLREYPVSVPSIIYTKADTYEYQLPAASLPPEMSTIESTAQPSSVPPNTAVMTSTSALVSIGTSPTKNPFGPSPSSLISRFLSVPSWHSKTGTRLSRDNPSAPTVTGNPRP